MKSSAQPDKRRSRKLDGYGRMTKLELIAALEARDRDRATPQDVLLRRTEDQQAQMELQNEQLSDAQAELEQSRHRYADLYDMAPVGYVTFDDKGCIREINHTACELLGYTAAHLIGKPLIPYLAQPDRKVFLQHLWQCRRAEKQLITTLRMIGRAGVERHVEFITRRAHDFESRPGWCRSAIVDVTDRRIVEMALSESEAKFRLMAENMGEVFWFLELEPFRVSYVSPAFERVWGIPVEELYADHKVWEQSLHPGDLPEVREAFSRWMTGESKAYHAHYRVIHRDGSIRWISDRGIVIRHKEGEGRPAQFCGIARDITERKKAEERLAEKARERTAILEGAFDGILIADIETRRFTFGNDAMCRMLGVTHQELLTMGVESIHPAESLPEIGRIFAAMARNETSIAENVPLLRKDGEIIPVDISGAPAVINGRKCNVGIFHDLTERKRAEERFRSLLESAPDAMMIHDADGRIQIVNAQAEKLFGYTRDELTGQTMEMLMPERFRHRHVEHRQGFTPTAKPRPMGALGMELLALHKDGREIPVEISLSNLATDGSPMVISSIRDITERQRAEDELGQSQRFAQSTLEAIPASLAVLDETGTIISTNSSWLKFGADNCGLPIVTGVGTNYLTVCDNAVGNGAEEAARFAAGIRDVIGGRTLRFSMEYPCHSAHEQRWFVGYVTPFMGDGPRHVVIAHLDISHRKRAEQVIRRLNDELETRVRERTHELHLVNEELQRQVAARRRLEEEILSVSEREQQRIGQDLHDDLGQQLAGAWMMSTVLARHLAAEGSREVPAANSISELLKNSVAMTRSLARGLHPVAAEPGALVVALRDLAARVCEMFHVDCRFTCDASVNMDDNTTATHLYRIAQEAVTNGIKHGHAKRLRISLASDAESITLSITDDGSGIGPLDPNRQGMGLRIMRYRADMIGATLSIEKLKKSGTCVCCTLPHSKPVQSQEVPHGQKSIRKARGSRKEKSARRR